MGRGTAKRGDLAKYGPPIELHCRYRKCGALVEQGFDWHEDLIA